MSQNLLEVRHLKTYFYMKEGIVPAVDDVSFSVREGQTVGLVGESGCGKSISCLSILRLVPDPPGKIVSGQVIYNNCDLLSLRPRQMQKIRGKDIAMIFQEPMTSLNPVLSIGRQLTETMQNHQKMNHRKALVKASQLLESVGLSEPSKRLRDFPHQLSGGMRQRVMIAMALSCDPSLLIADEPTTALDVTIQAQILDLMRSLAKKRRMSMLIITHDLGVIARMVEKVIVMYAGKIVEQANVKDLFSKPLHPYTLGLLRAVPRIDAKKGQLHVIKGTVPDPTEYPAGCRFHPRCELKKGICEKKEPALRMVAQNRTVRCWIGTPVYESEV